MTTETAVGLQGNLIGGEWGPSSSGRTFENRNPADRDDLVGIFPESGREDVEAAVAAARKAYPAWRDMPAPRRAEILFAAGEILKRDKEDLARLHRARWEGPGRDPRGLAEAATCVPRGGEGRRLFGFTTP